MQPIAYNRALTGETYLLRIYTPRSLATLLGTELGVLFFTDSYFAAVALFMAFSAYQTYLRFGKPPGYDEHLLAGFLAPKQIRPGHAHTVNPVKESEDEKIHGR
jgi:hypothetical protein